jgi:uncharacterized protein YlxW (UPF0749 family)
MPYQTYGAKTPSSSPVRGWPWRALVPIVFAIAGFLFGTSHRVAQGTDLRTSSSENLLSLTRNAIADGEQTQQEITDLQQRLQAQNATVAGTDSAVAAAQARSAPLRGPAGLTQVSGPGLIVTLDDASVSTAPDGVDLNQLVVHQSDLQAVVNALWAGGAEAMTIAGQRVIATSAVRCVGNTLLLNGRVYSPPFRVAAIGPAAAMQKQLDASPGVRLFRQAADYYGLRYSVSSSGSLLLPAYDQTITTTHATPLTPTPQPTPIPVRTPSLSPTPTSTPKTGHR